MAVDGKSSARSLIPELARQFYTLGWVSGTGGGISIREGDRVYIAPSGVQKERIQPGDLFVLDRNTQDVIETPTSPNVTKISECTPLFFAAFRLRNAGAVIHSHSLNAVFATKLNASSEFKIRKMEMIKGIKGHGYADTLVVPIIENTARECELTESLTHAIEQYPATYAILVRNHGVYVWGDTWEQAKGHAECYDYLFEASVKARMYGLAADESFSF